MLHLVTCRKLGQCGGGNYDGGLYVVQLVVLRSTTFSLRTRESSNSVHDVYYQCTVPSSHTQTLSLLLYWTVL